MDNSLVLRTVVPILLLMVLGYLSRKIGILKFGDERVLNAYVYYFALPALFIVDLAKTDFNEGNLMFVLAGMTPIFLVLLIYILLYFTLRFSKNTLYLLIMSTIFGSLAFFGIPFIVFVFPAEGEYLATLAVASISIISVAISIIILELYGLKGATLSGRMKHIAKRLSKNPLILSIVIGVLLSIGGVELPSPIATSLHMLGVTTAPVAIFLLGVFLYGRKYTHIAEAFGLSLLRIVFLPVTALLITTLFGLNGLEKTTLVVMHGVPVAVSMIILSERYDFYKETIASLILISSVAAGIYLNLWLIILGY